MEELLTGELDDAMEGMVGRRRLSHVRAAVIALTLTDLAVHGLKASALFDLLAPPLDMAGVSVVLP
jgi:hypothetical protein